VHAAVSEVCLTIEPVPGWLDVARWLGAAPHEREPLPCGRLRIVARLDPARAADVMARLRGLGLDGRPLLVQTEPALSRPLVRAARLREARARRDTTPGFVRRGTVVTGEGRYSLTPEALALAVGKLAAGARVVDACCGSGGNAIGFARAGCDVTAIERDAARLDEARLNARVYGVHERIRFEHADAVARVLAHRGDVLFVDPPWGEHYDKRATRRADFPLLDALVGLDLRACYRELWVKVPSSFEVASLGANVEAQAFFGTAAGDATRIKFVLLRQGLAR